MTVAPDRRRRPTTTSNFGVGRREAHDASDFYARFTPPDLSDSTTIGRRKEIDDIFAHDASVMPEVDDNSVALVVTSPPYFAGKAYEEALGEGHIPANYFEYLSMLEAVFDECVRTLEPGGRIAVNVANLGRRPYRSLSADVIDILERKLRLLLRGEVIWHKARGAGGSCAWGSFQRPANPVFRDLTERVIIASKGRFDRALSARDRQGAGLPSETSISREEFMEATTDVWEMAPESAKRVGHPAPFPVELPERLIHLYTYYGDLVLDPFMGSGTTAVAAIRTERHFVGYDTDPAYVDAARRRVLEEAQRTQRRAEPRECFRVSIPATPRAAPENEDLRSRAVREGKAAKEIAEGVLRDCGFEDIEADVTFAEGVEVHFTALDRAQRRWYFDVSGGFTSTRAGLRRSDTLWKALGKAAVLHEIEPKARLVLITTDAPARNSRGDAALGTLRGDGKPIFDIVELGSRAAIERLASHNTGEDEAG